MITNEHLTGSKIVDSGQDFLVFEKDKEKIQAFIQRDPEGNGPGFLFGLPMPDTPTLTRLHENGAPFDEIQRVWNEEYLRGAVGIVIDSVGTVDSGDRWIDDFPCLNGHITIGDERIEVLLEVSQDQEGNGPGFLDLIKMD